ncbi:MAG: hypothetical protein AB1716_22595 [Planctomycetota bacterium]
MTIPATALATWRWRYMAGVIVIDTALLAALAAGAWLVCTRNPALAALEKWYAPRRAAWPSSWPVG